MSGWDRHEYTAAGDTRMHAAVLGPDGAPPVVLVPGLGCSYRYYLPLARRLAPQFQAVAVDLPGFGRSPGPPAALDVRGMSLALADWLRATDRDGALLVGDSTGCQAIVDLAITASELMGPVVLCGPTFDRHHRSVWWQSSALALNVVGGRTGRGLLPIRLQDRLDSTFRRWVDTFLLLLPDPVERKIDKIHTPAAVVGGERDPVVPRRWAAELVELLPHGHLVTIPGNGHTVHYGAPAAVAAVCREVTARAAPRRPGSRVGAER